MDQSNTVTSYVHRAAIGLRVRLPRMQQDLSEDSRIILAGISSRRMNRSVQRRSRLIIQPPPEMAGLISPSLRLGQYARKRIPAPSKVTAVASGFDQPLYMLPFDQRESFQTKIFGWKGALNIAQTAEIAVAKQVVYDGFRAAVEGGAPKERAAILVDEQFGAAILRNASRQGYITACPAEKSGQKEFDLEYGKEFARHIEAFDPTFCKVLVRYNPRGDRSMNRRQAARLRRLSDYLRGTERKLMFELLVPAEQVELDELEGDKGAYDRLRRPQHMVDTILDLQNAGVEPDVWKVEGLDRSLDCANVVAAARRDGRDRVACIVLGRGADAKQVERWLVTAASVPGFVGFAVGRTTFWDALLDWRANRITRDAAITEIARRYRHWVDIFEQAACAAA